MPVAVTADSRLTANCLHRCDARIGCIGTYQSGATLTRSWHRMPGSGRLEWFKLPCV